VPNDLQQFWRKETQAGHWNNHPRHSRSDLTVFWQLLSFPTLVASASKEDEERCLMLLTPESMIAGLHAMNAYWLRMNQTYDTVSLPVPG